MSAISWRTAPPTAHRNRDGVGGSSLEASMSRDHVRLRLHGHIFQQPADHAFAVPIRGARVLPHAREIVHQVSNRLLFQRRAVSVVRLPAGAPLAPGPLPVHASERSSRLPAHLRPGDSQDPPLNSGAALVRRRSAHAPPVGRADAGLLHLGCEFFVDLDAGFESQWGQVGEQQISDRRIHPCSEQTLAVLVLARFDMLLLTQVFRVEALALASPHGSVPSCGCRSVRR